MKRLRLDRIRERISTPGDVESLSIKDQAVLDMREHRAKTTNHREEFGDSLLYLFNNEKVDFVRKEGSRWIPMILPQKATHRLISTASIKDSERTLATPRRVKFASSVCAIPLKRKMPQTGVKITRPFPKQTIVYKKTSSIKAKRNVLRFLVERMRAKVQLLALRKMNNDECDKLYSALKRANLILRCK